MPLIRLDQVSAPAVLEGHRYWRGKCRDGRLPGRRDIVPSEIKPLLSFVILSEVLRDPFDIRFRLVGTKVVEMNNVDLTGRHLNYGVSDPAWRDYWTAIYRRVAETGEPAFGADTYEYRDRSHAGLEWCLLPLAADGRNVDMIFELEAYPPGSRPGPGSPALAGDLPTQSSPP